MTSVAHFKPRVKAGVSILEMDFQPTTIIDIRSAKEDDSKPTGVPVRGTGVIGVPVCLRGSHLSAEAKEAENHLNSSIYSNPTINECRVEPNELDERLFDATAVVKILLSRVSMHFSDALRQKLFRQIDLIHDPDDWEESEMPIEPKSFSTFLRWFYMNDPTQLPNFGLSDTGQFIATWLANQNKDSLILEFLKGDRIKWYVTKYYEDEEAADLSSGVTNLDRIASALEAFNANDWFNKKA